MGRGWRWRCSASRSPSLRFRPSDVLISSKLGWKRAPLTTPEPTFEPGVWIDIEHDAVQRISYDGILECWEESCRLLGDAYQAAARFGPRSG